jgi:hypothetical protein
MKAIIDWLMKDEQKTLFDFVFAIALTILFLTLTAQGKLGCSVMLDAQLIMAFVMKALISKDIFDGKI